MKTTKSFAFTFAVLDFRAAIVAAIVGASAVTTCLGQPTIVRQLADFPSVSLGVRVANSVSPLGNAFSYQYQWHFNGAALTSATNQSLVLTNLQLTHVGNYFVVVSDSSGSVISRVARLEIDPTFTKVTTGSIVTDLFGSTGAAWGDYDNDGDLDVFVGTAPGQPDRFYLNNGDGTFASLTNNAVSRIARDLGYGNGPSWADYDNDGYLDLFVAIWDGSSRLFRNVGGTLSDGPIVTPSAFSSWSTWGDYDNDGFLDLFVGNGWTQATERNFLYRNNGDGTLTRITTTNSVGRLAVETGGFAGCAWVDYDDDNDLDLFVCGMSNRNLLYRNDGNGYFTKVTDTPLTSVTGLNSSCAWGDYDNDGDLDVFVTIDGGQKNQLYQNVGNGSFVRVTQGAVVNDVSARSVACSWGDYDNDGFLDLIVATHEKNFLYRNQGDGTFARITTGNPSNDTGHTWGVAWVDYDNDGFLDLHVANGASGFQENNFLYRNTGNTNRWLKLRLVGTVSNRSAIGAKVRVKAIIRGKSFWQRRQISSGSGQESQEDTRPNFGLGDATVAETVRIEWPSGIVQELRDVAANQILTVTEPARLQAQGAGVLRVQSWKGMAFEVQTSTNLTQWSPLTTVTNLTGTLEFTDPDAANDSRRFYRTVLR